MNDIVFHPVGMVEADAKYRFETPRQSVFAGNTGIIRMNPQCNFETALRDLDGFSHIWVIFCFHLNQSSGWKPAVNPPIAPSSRKIGVFATRSPHRPNSIGISCVELTAIDGLELHIRNFDMLDGTPVLDIKPYIIHADCFPEASTGWLPPLPEPYQVNFTKTVLLKIEWLREQSGLDLQSFALIQLGTDPLNRNRKRLNMISEQRYIICCRTWKLSFSINPETRNIEVADLHSGYNAEELIPNAPDKYHDKTLHRRFLKIFGAL